MSKSTETAFTRSSTPLFPADSVRDLPASRADRSGVRARPRYEPTPVVDWTHEAARRIAMSRLTLYLLNTLGVLPAATLALLDPAAQSLVRRFTMSPALAIWFCAILVASLFAVDVPRLWTLSRRPKAR